MDLKCKVNFSDVDAFFDNGEWEVEKAMIDAGDNAVKHAEENGDYPDRTLTLRTSNKFDVEKDRLILYNDAQSPNGYHYAADVEAKGYDVLSSAALGVEKELKEKFER